MSTAAASRGTLADLVVLISEANISGRQKQDLRSAVRTVARLLGGAPEKILADPARLGRRLDGLSPEAYGLTKGRWNNLRSLLTKALRLSRPMLAGRSTEALLAGWERLLVGVGQDRRWSVTPFLRFLSEKAIGPEHVRTEDVEAYRAAIFNDRLRRNPERSWDALVWAWNACAREIANWPRLTIERPRKRNTYILPWSAFPDSLRVDADGYLARLAGVDLCDDGPAKPARSGTLKTRAYHLRVSASALFHRGVPAENIRTIADLVVMANYQSILRFFLDRHDDKPGPWVGQIAGFLKDVARHWVKVDDETLSKMSKIVSRLTPSRRGMTNKNRERLRPLDDPEKVIEFLSLPERIRKAVEKDKRSPRLKALLSQMAAAIALLQAAPIRRANLASLDLNKHLISRGKRLYLVIEAEDVKNSEPIDFELPARTVEILAWYVREHRPHLVNVPSDALFPGKNGKSKHPNTVGNQVSETVLRYTGMPFNTHLFRHAGGKIFLDARPGQYEVMRRVLGHRCITTTTSIYAGAETRSAGTHFASVIAERQRDLELRSGGERHVSARPKRIGTGGKK
jgi:integrase